jgi:acetolactate synthase I/II/III large subunit
MRLTLEILKILNDFDFVLEAIGNYTGPDTSLGSTHEKHILLEYVDTCIITNGFCSMGFALPGAIAAQLARPKQKVIAMCGDGGFLMNVQELETAVRLKLPVILVVWCDSDLGMISLKQIDEFRKSAFTRFNNPDFVKLAKSFGANGYDVQSTIEFPEILKKATESKDVPVVISVDVDYSKNRVLLDDSFIV